jgi:hypothetical protein
MNVPKTMELLIDTDGTARSIYGELFDLSALGAVEIRRASSVEPDALGSWWADLAAVGGPRLGPFQRRSDAIAAEVSWLRDQIENNSFQSGRLAGI